MSFGVMKFDVPDFCLSSKRKELEDKILSGEIDIRKVFCLIEAQDKEFIRLLKKEISDCDNPNDRDWLLEKLHELAGGAFIISMTLCSSFISIFHTPFQCFKYVC